MSQKTNFQENVPPREGGAKGHEAAEWCGTTGQGHWQHLITEHQRQGRADRLLLSHKGSEWNLGVSQSPHSDPDLPLKASPIFKLIQEKILRSLAQENEDKRAAWRWGYLVRFLSVSCQTRIPTLSWYLFQALYLLYNVHSKYSDEIFDSQSGPAELKSWMLHS